MATDDDDDSNNYLNFDYTSHVEKLQRQLEASYRREAELDQEIREILRRNADLPKHLNVVLGRMKTRLALAESDASQLSSLLSLTSVLAENVSGKVRELDLSKTRVVDCLQRVEDALDLRFCTEGIRTAMANEDYEQAAAHVHRFLMLDSSVLGLGATTKQISTSEGAGDAPPSTESLEQQFQIMKEAENELKRIVVVKFDEASRDGDVASMERFFKLFPLLNQHEIGLTKFGAYLKTKIADAAEKNYKIMSAGGQDDSRANVLYADTLTLLLEGVARVLEVHQPLIESYYGPDRLLKLAEILQEQCDVETDRILDQFVKIRQYNGKAKLIDTYSRQSTRYAQLEKLDPTELDLLLSEVTVLQTRVELYFRFLRRRIGPNLANLPEDNDAMKEAKREKMHRLESLIRGCRLSRRMQELIGRYIAMEEYYMRETTLKAVDMDVKEGQSLTSSMVDDVFFVIRKCVRRTLSSSNVDCVCAMLNNACALLETDYLLLIQNRLKAGYPAVGSFAEAYTTAAAAYVSVVQQGKIPASGGDSAEKARDEFLTALNNADSSADCVKTLKESLQTEIYKYVGKLTDQDSAKLESCLGQSIDVARKLRDLAKNGLDQLVTAAAKPRLKVFAEHFLDHTHAPTDAEFNEFEANDPFVEQFVTGLDSLLAAFKQCLTESNFQIFVDVTSGETAKQLEKVVMKCTFNRLGGLLFDKQLRELNAYLTTMGGWTVREKFARLTQLASILNVDSVNEAKEYYQSATVSWRLSPAEFRKVLAIRADLPGEEIRKLKL